MKKELRIGTRDSQLAVWQATWVQNLLKKAGASSQLVYIKSEGDIDTVTPLYQLGVQGIFTKTLDAALLNNRIDIAVHSMKDVPTQMAQGLQQAAVLQRASYKDIFVYKNEEDIQSWQLNEDVSNASLSDGLIATSSIRRRAQWLHRYPQHRFENLRGNVNTRLRKLEESNWNGAIFAAAGLERINVRPQKSIDLDWMLPAPAQGAIMIACREGDEESYEACHQFNHPITALCTKIERDFLKTLSGGCSTPISGLAVMEYAQIVFTGNICSTDGAKKIDIKKIADIEVSENLGIEAGKEILQNGGQAIVENIREKSLS
ncbi:MAG TPA: hydroxymethylbilane synthase [Chitinophagaceae bacterium]|jgi:hydroxymethylbilane synthase|nr:hydroxymethylbilane synthase [Chitinophagaceae bacterium]